MELDISKNSVSLPQNIKSRENTLSCSHSNNIVLSRKVEEEPIKVKGLRKLNPFGLIRNFRELHPSTHQISKRGKNQKDKTKRKLSQNQELGSSNTIKKQRKMTQNIGVQILEEEEVQISYRNAHSQAKIEIEFDSQYYMNEQEIWRDSELEKMIPMEIGEDFLNLQSPLELSSFRNISSFEDTAIKKNQ